MLQGLLENWRVLQTFQAIYFTTLRKFSSRKFHRYLYGDRQPVTSPCHCRLGPGTWKIKGRRVASQLFGNTFRHILTKTSISLTAQGPAVLVGRFAPRTCLGVGL